MSDTSSNQHHTEPDPLVELESSKWTSTKQSIRKSPPRVWPFIVKLSRSRSMLVAIGFAVGTYILVHDYSLNEAYLKTTPFQLYALTIICQTVFGAVAIGSIVPTLWSLRRFAFSHFVEAALWVGLFYILIKSSKYFAVSCPAYSFRNHDSKTNSLTYVVGLVALLAGLGSILVNIGLREFAAKSNELENPPKGKPASLSINSTSEIQNKDENAEQERQGRDAKLVKDYLQLRGHLLYFLSVVGILLGMVGIAQSAKRYMILESMVSADSARDCLRYVFPTDLSFVETPRCMAQGFYCETTFDLKKVFVYGLYYTVILVLTFLPTFSTLIATGHKLRDDILPIPSPHSEAWSSDCAKRAKLEKLLSLSVTEGLRALIAVLAPVLGTLISLLGLLK